MKLYVNHDQTQWRGTQADAKSAFGSIDTIDVPTDKAGLLEFLNNFTVKTTAIKRSGISIIGFGDVTKFKTYWCQCIVVAV